MKELVWVGSSLQDLKAFPDEVKRTMGMLFTWPRPVESTLTLNPSRASPVLGCLRLSRTSTAIRIARSTPYDSVMP